LIHRHSPAPQYVPTRSSILSELLHGFLLRFLATGVVGLLLGGAAAASNVSPLGFLNTVAVASFWVGAFLTASFGGHVGRMLLWLLLLESSQQLYQLGIYTIVADGSYTILRFGPTLLAGFLLLVSSGIRSPRQPFFCAAWVLCNLPSLISGLLFGYVRPVDAVIYYFVNAFYPLLFYYAVDCLNQDHVSKEAVSDIIAIASLAALAVPLLLIPLEFQFRNSTSFADLQYGRSYATVGSLVLVWGIIVSSLERWRLALRIAAWSIIVMVFLSSFSRGALVVFFAILLATPLVSKSGVLARNLLLAVLATVATAYVLFPKIAGEAGWFWLLRLNLVSNVTTDVSINVNDILANERFALWDMAYTLFRQSPFFGYGIGSSPGLLSAITLNEISYSGMHNMFLTVLLERGLFGFLGAAMLVGRIVYLTVSARSLVGAKAPYILGLLIFLFFANTTGVELFMNSTRASNVTITVNLFLLVALLELCWERQPRPQRAGRQVK
jgi:O-antigen ligase